MAATLCWFMACSRSTERSSELTPKTYTEDSRRSLNRNILVQSRTIEPAKEMKGKEWLL